MGLDDVALALRSLRQDAGLPSYAEIARRIGVARALRGVPLSERRPARATVYDCFRTERRRLDIDLVVEIVRALGADDAEAARWAQLCRVAQSRADAATVVTVHATLPAGSVFVPRRAATEAALAAIEAAAAPGGTRVVCLEGMPGSGKSRLAVELARTLTADDGGASGQLHADLRGFHPELPPAAPAAVLEGFLRLLGVPARELPAGQDERRALLERHLRDRRHVVVLDDAADAGQLLPLLPTGADAVVLVTSRTAVSETLTATDAVVTRVPVGPFSPDEAVELLRRVAGADPVDADAVAAVRLVEAVGCLPLAVHLTATRVAARPSWSVADHLDALLSRGAAVRLDEAVYSTLELSYLGLSPAAQATLRLLAVHSCPELDEAAVAALTGADTVDGRDALAELRAHHLAGEPRPGRFALHSLVRLFALDRSHDDDRPAERAAATDRLCDHYLAQVWAGYHAMFAPMGIVNRLPPDGVDVPEVDDETARQWLEANLGNLLTLAGHGPELGRPELASGLSDGASWWLNRYGRHTEAKLLHGLALDAALQAGDRVGEARARLDLGQVLVRLNEWDDATVQLVRAERLFSDAGDLYPTSAANNSLAIMDVHRGRLDQSIERFTRCVELARAAGNEHGVATALNNIAIVHRRAGRPDRALEFHGLAMEQAEGIGDRYVLVDALTNRSEAQLLLGRLDDALASATRGLAMAEELDDVPAIAYAHDAVGKVRAAGGDHAPAVDHYETALRLSRELTDRHLEAGVLNDLGATRLRRGELGLARDCHQEAHTVATEIGDRFEQARAESGLADVQAASGAAEPA
ncbi:ATP-binding protein [Jiangella mangrovi]|uniref:Tetratricopeptide (TPR) repeat protein n=1 Tax=Jiangella mangrovi TaxID=1524084 RepID=A0A7W9GSG4_9ACTN|nr:tetratricopeptide repeat protein [Jiangella mangrovi]MBB5788886.1 tetratricopeptide (TPR) repeat protein [Jiangella mangrovi]